jgi:hypothetical protein
VIDKPRDRITKAMKDFSDLAAAARMNGDASPEIARLRGKIEGLALARHYIDEDTDRCEQVVGDQHGRIVKCGAIRAIHGDALGMADHEFVAPRSGRPQAPASEGGEG